MALGSWLLPLNPGHLTGIALVHGRVTSLSPSGVMLGRSMFLVPSRNFIFALGPDSIIAYTGLLFL